MCVSHTGSWLPLSRAFLTDSGIPEGFERIKVVHNGVIDTGIPVVPSELKLNRFMFVSHLMPSKNVTQTLMMAIENRIQCLFVGRRLPQKKLSRREEEYAASCDRLLDNNKDIITHIPYLPYKQCIYEMARSKCLIILSELESFGFTPIEAAQVGTPTIWLGCQGIDETMQDGLTGFRIPRQLFKTWKKRRARAAELFNSVNTLNAQQMSAHVKHRFSMGACTHNYEDLYSEVMRGSATNGASSA